MWRVYLDAYSGHLAERAHVPAILTHRRAKDIDVRRACIVGNTDRLCVVFTASRERRPETLMVFAELVALRDHTFVRHPPPLIQTCLKPLHFEADRLRCIEAVLRLRESRASTPSPWHTSTLRTSVEDTGDVLAPLSLV